MTLTKATPPRRRLTHAIAELFPPQGQWSEDEYLGVSDRSNRLIELSNGKLEVLDMPTDPHQYAVGRLHYFILRFLMEHVLGEIRVAPLPVRLWPGKFREPDLMYLSTAHLDRITSEYWGVPDLVIEVHSPGSHHRDKRVKYHEYAQAGIAEYWMVDTDAKTIAVYRLHQEDYVLHRQYAQSETLLSEQLPGFELNLVDVFAKA
ncbi:MAG: Uma2 family endonuclease [Thermoflexales bacterium]|nr:Uma2 family endonuclease [Thermoflexales bacterium]